MSIKVSYLKSNDTDNGNGWTNHIHRLSVQDYNVPSYEEFSALKSKVDECLSDLDGLSQKVDEQGKMVDQYCTEVNLAIKKSESAVKKTREIGKALKDTGVLASAFGRIVDENLARIQNENRKVAQAIERLRECGVIKPDQCVIHWEDTPNAKGSPNSVGGSSDGVKKVRTGARCKKCAKEVDKRVTKKKRS